MQAWVVSVVGRRNRTLNMASATSMMAQPMFSKNFLPYLSTCNVVPSVINNLNRLTPIEAAPVTPIDSNSVFA